MEIHLTVEREAQLFHIAAQEGKDADEFAREVLLRGLDAEAALAASRPGDAQRREVVSRIFELRRGNLLPPGVTIEDLIHEGRA